MATFDVYDTMNKLAIITDAVNNADIPDELDDIIDNCHRNLKHAYRLLESYLYELEELRT